jgi:hypothetical protein
VNVFNDQNSDNITVFTLVMSPGAHEYNSPICVQSIGLSSSQCYRFYVSTNGKVFIFESFERLWISRQAPPSSLGLSHRLPWAASHIRRDPSTSSHCTRCGLRPSRADGYWLQTKSDCATHAMSCSQHCSFPRPHKRMPQKHQGWNAFNCANLVEVGVTTCGFDR